jgi:hypothetical protein
LAIRVGLKIIDIFGGDAFQNSTRLSNRVLNPTIKISRKEELIKVFTPFKVLPEDLKEALVVLLMVEESYLRQHGLNDLFVFDGLERFHRELG